MTIKIVSFLLIIFFGFRSPVVCQATEENCNPMIDPFKSNFQSAEYFVSNPQNTGGNYDGDCKTTFQIIHAFRSSGELEIYSYSENECTKIREKKIVDRYRYEFFEKPYLENGNENWLWIRIYSIDVRLGLDKAIIGSTSSLKDREYKFFCKDSLGEIILEEKIKKDEARIFHLKYF